MIQWKTSCTLRAVHHSITLELWFSALQASAGVVAKPTWTDCCESWGRHRRDTAVKLWHTFASSTLLRCRHARCAHEMRLARQLELTLSIHRLQNDHCLKGLQSGFRTISWIFHVISTIQGKHICHMCDPRSKIWICVIWMTFSGDRKKQPEFNGSCLCRAGTRPFRLFCFPWCFSFFPAGTRPGRSGAVQSLEFPLLTSINLQSFSKLKESQESVSVPFTTLRILRI